MFCQCCLEILNNLNTGPHSFSFCTEFHELGHLDAWNPGRSGTGAWDLPGFHSNGWRRNFTWLPWDILFNCFTPTAYGYTDVPSLRLPWENLGSGECGMLGGRMNSCKVSLESRAETLPPERLPRTSFPLLCWEWALVPSSKSFSKCQCGVHR